MSFKIIILSFAACLPAALAFPRPDLKDVNAATNSSICPFVVDLSDRKADRIPELIPQVRCVANPADSCKDYGIPTEYCCPTLREQNTYCAELQEEVFVYTKGHPNTPKPYQISVGCACLYSKPSHAIYATK